MMQPTMPRWTTSLLLSLGAGVLWGAALAGCTGDEFTAGGDGGSGGTGSAATTSTGDSTTSTTTASGGECSAGCLDEAGECREEQSIEHCGLGGAACTSCSPPIEECTEAYCKDDGSCGIRNLPELSECSAGACVNGSCKADAEVCLNDLDEDDDGDVGCKDQDCRNAGYACSDGREDGFAGPFLVVEGPGDASCPAGLEPGPTYYTDPEAACGCFTEVECAVELTRTSDGDCEVNPQTTVLAPGACTDLVTTLGNGLSLATTCEAQAAPQDTSVTTLTPCVLPDFGCNEGEGCMPPVPPPGAGRNLLCIAAEGDHGCEGWNIRRLAFDMPDVDCACSCTPDPACAGSVSTWTGDACSVCTGSKNGGCTDLSVPPSDETCTEVILPGTHARFDLENPGTPTLEGVPFLGGNQATFCCVAYPQTDG